MPAGPAVPPHLQKVLSPPSPAMNRSPHWWTRPGIVIPQAFKVRPGILSPTLSRPENPTNGGLYDMHGNVQE